MDTREGYTITTLNVRLTCLRKGDVRGMCGFRNYSRRIMSEDNLHSGTSGAVEGHMRFTKKGSTLDKIGTEL